MDTIGNININFSVFSEHPRYLSIMDLSDWLYAKELPSYILITIPGSKKPKKFTFKKEKVTTYNSHNLGLSCLKGDCTEEEYVDLPDGIYTICVKSGYEGIENSKFYLKTDRFEVEMAKVLIKNGLEYDTDFILYIARIRHLLDVSKSHALLGDFVKAQRFFEESKELLKKYIECADCI